MVCLHCACIETLCGEQGQADNVAWTNSLLIINSNRLLLSKFVCKDKSLEMNHFIFEGVLAHDTTKQHVFSHKTSNNTAILCEGGVDPH